MAIEWTTDLCMTTRNNTDLRHPHGPRSSTWPGMPAWATNIPSSHSCRIDYGYQHGLLGQARATEVFGGGPSQKMNHLSSQTSCCCSEPGQSCRWAESSGPNASLSTAVSSYSCPGHRVSRSTSLHCSCTAAILHLSL